MIFLGQVRADEINGKKVKAIEYSAYERMVNVEAEKIKNQILSEFGDVKSIDIIHSTGIVNAGEIISCGSCFSRSPASGNTGLQ